jgi:predicted ArsR family transcriptional regulator
VSSPTIGAERLFAKDIAAHLHVSVRQARRWLRDLEKERGPLVVGRVGSGRTRHQRYTTRAALVGAQPVAGHSTLDMCERIEHLEDELRIVSQIAYDLLRRIVRMGG